MSYDCLLSLSQTDCSGLPVEKEQQFPKPGEPRGIALTSFISFQNSLHSEIYCREAEQ